MLTSTQISVKAIRQHLHAHPELSGEEHHTAKYIASQVQLFEGFELYEGLGGSGLIALKTYGPGPVVAYRAELDALPISGQVHTNYRPAHSSKAHACGHDGHMAMLFDLVRRLEEASTARGTLMLIFQPAEETGEGAAAMLADIKEKQPTLPVPQACFAIHNIPGRPLGEVLIRNEHFACASVGVRLVFKGRTAHAAHPEQAINPLSVAADLLTFAARLPKLPGIKEFALSTAIALRAGEPSFGTSPAQGECLFTLRARRTSDLRAMCTALEREAQALASKAGLEVAYSEHEFFPALVNAPFAEKAQTSAEQAGLKYAHLEVPFRWSEDFAHFADWCPVFMMGLGSGEAQPALHAPDFDFPDALLPKGGALYYELYNLWQNDA